MCNTAQKFGRISSERAPNTWRRRSVRTGTPKQPRDLERALASLWIAFQPIVRAADGATFGYEALVRTREPAVPTPAALLGLAESLGRMAELGRAIRRCSLAAVRAHGGQFSLFMNLHPYELLDEALVSDIGASGLAERIVLEITERASLAAVPDLPGRLRELRRLGCRIAIDDLGAGYSGLSSFVELAPDIVKIDMSLVRDAHQNPVKRHVIRALTEMCKTMRLSVVAEGIENREERDVVVALGCDLLQGFHLGRPNAAFLPPRT